MTTLTLTSSSTTNSKPTKSVLAVFISLVVCVQVSLAYPYGAPDSACKSLKPGHGVEPLTSPSPFELIQDKQDVAAGEQIKVHLSSSSKNTFKGLFVQAQNAKGEPVGKFLPGKGLTLISSCSSVTHADKVPKKTATLVWEAPSDLKGTEKITFKATVLQKFDEYHTGIISTVGNVPS